MPDSSKGSNKRRGLASADEGTKKRVASEGGTASHKNVATGSSKSSGGGHGGSSRSSSVKRSSGGSKSIPSNSSRGRD